MSDNNVIPFVRDKKERDKLRQAFLERHRYGSDNRIKAHLDNINKKMDELRAMARYYPESVPPTESANVALPPTPAAYNTDIVLPPPPVETKTLNQSELEKEYWRKQDEMRKKRSENNSNTINNYGLLRKPGQDPTKK